MCFKLIIALNELAKDCIEEMRDKDDMDITENQQNKFELSEYCQAKYSEYPHTN